MIDNNKEVVNQTETEVNQSSEVVNQEEKLVNQQWTHIKLRVITKKMSVNLATELNMTIDELVNQLIIDKRFENYKARMANR